MEHNSITLRSAAFVAVRLAVACICSYYTAKMLIKYLDPTYSQKKSARRLALKQLSRLGIHTTQQLSDYELQIAAQIVAGDEAGVSWSDVGGYDDLLAELKETVILPLKLRSSSTFLQAPKGVLLYGPPGCGKTLIARAIAKDAGASFINLDISSLTDKWYGESQKLAAAVFTLATKIQPAIIFIDEIDSFLRVRESRDHEATAMMKAQFLSNWDGFASDPNCRVVIIGASNRPLDVDPAILRRMPSRFCLGLPDEKQRAKVLHVLLRDEQLHPDVNLDEIAAQCEMFSCSDLRELCRLAAITRVRDLLRSEANLDALNEQPFRLADFREALIRMKRDDGFKRNIGLDGGFSE